MTLQLYKGANRFDLTAIEEGIRQSELSLTDARVTKESLDKKTFFLLPVFISLPVAILTLMEHIGSQKYLSESFILFIAFFFCKCGHFIIYFFMVL